MPELSVFRGRFPTQEPNAKIALLQELKLDSDGNVIA